MRTDEELLAEIEAGITEPILSVTDPELARVAAAALDDTVAVGRVTH